MDHERQIDKKIRKKQMEDTRDRIRALEVVLVIACRELEEALNRKLNRDISELQRYRDEPSYQNVFQNVDKLFNTIDQGLGCLEI